jgi:hypothetical protein
VVLVERWGWWFVRVAAWLNRPQVAYIDTEGETGRGLACSTSRPPGTFRPDRIRAIADRFGVDAEAALGNILYGKWAFSQSHSLFADSFS